jgi:hypothetical protein
VLQIRGILAKRKDLIARNQETERPGACRAYPVAADHRRIDEFLFRGLNKTSEMTGKYVSESTAPKRNFPATSDVICCAMPRLVWMDFFYESFRTNARQSVHRAKEGQPFRAGLGSEREITWVEGCRTGHLLRRLVRP